MENNSILSNSPLLKEILYLMKENSLIKEYNQYIKKYKYVNHIYQKVFELKKNKFNYIYSKNNIEYIDSKCEITNEEMIKHWIKNFGHSNKDYIPIKVSYGKKKIDLEEKKFIESIKKISNIYRKYQFEIYYEDYAENLLLSKGILECRKLSYIVLNIKKGNIEIDDIFYEKVPSVQEIRYDIQQSLEHFNYWSRLEVDNIKLKEKSIITCLMMPEASGRVFHEAIGHLVEKDVFEENKKDGINLNYRIGNEQLEVLDIPKERNIDTNILFDDKGIKASKIKIVDKGILVGIMDDAYTMNIGYYKAGFVRNSIDNDEPQIRMRNLIIKDGTLKFEELIKNFKNGLIVEKISDSYRIGQEVYLKIDRGIMVLEGSNNKRIENIILHCKTKELLMSIESICNNGKWDKLKRCKKNGGSIYISTYAPSIICKMMI